MFRHLHTSSKVITAALFSVALLAFALWQSPLLQSPSSRTADTTSLKGIRGATSTAQYTQDSDGDGVFDWEEVLLGTDPNNRDSDNDGIGDGAELEKARNTLSAQSHTNTTTANTAESKSATDRLTREIFGAYIQSKQQGTYNPEAFDFVVAQATNKQFNTHYEPAYTRERVATTSDTSKERVLSYKHAFRDAIAPVTSISEYELTTYGRAVSGDKEAFSKLGDAASVYRAIARDLLTITAPFDAIQEHLDLVNSFYTFADILTTMSNTSNDPMRAFVVTRDFLEGEDAIKGAYSQMEIYFTLKELDTI